MIGPRVVIVGPTGSGKTTLACALGQRCGLPVIELDALHWLEGWQMQSLERFRAEVDRLTAAPAWIIDGNYSKVRDLVWPRAISLIWLDYPLPVVFWRLLRRSLRRSLRREHLWNNNYETLRGTLFAKDSLLRWLFESLPRQRKAYPQLFSLPEHAHLQVIRLHSPAETRAWLAAQMRA